jgi:hypothetical protein
MPDGEDDDSSDDESMRQVDSPLQPARPMSIPNRSSTTAKGALTSPGRVV